MLWIHTRLIRESRDQLAFDQSPELIAVFHALHRLLAPRHPPHALSSLAALIDPLIHPQDSLCSSWGLTRKLSCSATVCSGINRTELSNELIFVSHDAYREILSFPHKKLSSLCEDAISFRYQIVKERNRSNEAVDYHPRDSPRTGNGRIQK